MFQIIARIFMLKEVLISFFGLACLVHTAQAQLPHFKHYVIFGDSLTDVGNYTTSSNNCIYFNAPITNHKNKIKSHYTNTTWANAGRLKNILPSNDGGTNYAVAGYTTAHILTSVKNYASNHPGDADTLYIIWAGTNDVLYAVSNRWPDEAIKETLTDGVNNIILSLNTLYERRARHFLVIGLMDLSQTPMATYSQTDQSMLLGLFPKNEDKSRLQRACFEWNNLLFSNVSHSKKNYLEQFRKNHSNSHIYTWNPIPLLADVVKNPEYYEYSTTPLVFNTKNSTRQDAYYPFSQITHCGNTADEANTNPDDYMFYNFIHPTPHLYSIMEHDLMKHAVEIS
jgi:phospholipase/lecithinase/hemolysin